MIFSIKKIFAGLADSLLRPWLISALVMFGGFGITVGLWRDAQHQIMSGLQAEFDVAADQIAHNVLKRIITYEVIMRGVKGYFEGSKSITRDEFRTYVQDLQIQEKTPGVQGIGLVLMVHKADKASHESAIRKLGFPDYHIKPEGKRDRYAPIVLMEPLEDNANALGFDILTVPEVSVALERSAETGEVAVTNHITLIQDSGKPDLLGLVMYLPIYRNGVKPDKQADLSTAITGWVDVPFRINDLMAGLRGEFDPDLLVEIHDGEPKSGQTRLYRSDGKLDQDILSSDSPQTRRQVDVGDHQWMLLMSTTPAFEARMSSKNQPVQVAVTGAAITLLLSALIWFQTSRRNHAHAYFRLLFDLDGDGVLILNPNFNIIKANPAALNMLGYTAKELLQLHLPDILAKKEHQRLEPVISRLMTGSRHREEWLYLRKNGSEFPVEVGAHRMDGKRFIAVLRDLTEQKKAEQRIQRLTQLYQALSETNQAIVRMENGTDLFSMVCRYAVQHGGMTMAWIGQLEESGSSIVPVSAYGTGLECLDSLTISSSEDVSEKCGPTAAALLENRAVIINDYLAASLTCPKHALVEQFGWGSAAAFPIQRNAKPFAVFNVYHTETDAFDTEAVRLLTEMAGDVSFALDNFDREVRRLTAEKALAESEARMSLILENVGAFIYLKDSEGRYLFANRQLLDLWETTPEEVIGFGDEKFFDEQTVARIRETDRRILVDGETIRTEETNSVSKTGKTATYWTVKLPLHRPDGRIYALCGISTDITERKQAEIALREGEERYRLLFTANPVPMWVYDLNTLAFITVNNAAITHYGYTREEFLGMTITELCPMADVPDLQAKIQQPAVNIGIYNQAGICRHRKKDGSLIWVEISEHTLNFEGLDAKIVLAFDVSSRIASEQQLRLNAQVFECSREGILITDAGNKIVAVNSAYCEMSGYKPEEVLGKNPGFISAKRLDKSFYDAMWQDIVSYGHWQGEVINRRKNGDIFPLRLSISVIRDQNGRIVDHICIMSDLTEQKAATELIQFLSNFDPLTKLPNRTLLRDRTELAISSSLRTDSCLALMYIDLDRFNIINDSLGSENGDLLLKELSVRLTDYLHPDDTLCRQGGDEFILLLPDTDAEGTAHVAKKILEITARPFIIGNQRVALTASVGIALFPQDGANFEQLTQSADAALFRAKQNGRNNFQFFTRQLHEQVKLMLQIENELRLALEQGQLLLYYQPQVDAKTLKIIGAEALIRWQHPLKGMVPPGRFIPIAEESGLIIDIGDWVLQAAILQLTAWQTAGLAIVPVAVNLSVVQFRQDTLYDKIVQLLRESKLDPAMLELEMTEGIAMENSERTISLLDKLHALGVSLSVDDFGTGYSSLSYLKRFKIDKLKIDQSFVHSLGHAPEDEAIVLAIISLAKSLGFKTIAEGVETREQLEFLLEKQCDEIQGYYFSKPVPADVFADMLRNGGELTEKHR
ncbi:MAG: EAL domain-containing protein [Methylobacter sp.]|nr:EAL domain-containing protein [Methylobacter sp.]